VAKVQRSPRAARFSGCLWAPLIGNSDVPSQERDLVGRFIVITGANTGIGRSTAQILAARGASLVLACRSKERTQPLLDALGATGADGRFVPLDLADLASVRAAAAQIIGLGRPIDVLLNNAGLAGHRGVTRDGFELTFGTNHLGHFLLTMLLAPNLSASSPLPRIVNVSSQAHYAAKGIDFGAVRAKTKTVTGLPEYSVSKLANVLFTAELARRLGPEGPHSYAVHPGVVASDAWRRIPWPIRPLMKLRMISNDDGARTSLYCATSPEAEGETGLYYDDCASREPSAVAQDPDLAERLWAKSVEWTGADWP
jgi:NAD(P)-dependent dehydrogenase (short-subunit alcohol dehydrogenase family)